MLRVSMDRYPLLFPRLVVPLGVAFLTRVLHLAAKLSHWNTFVFGYHATVPFSWGFFF